MYVLCKHFFIWFIACSITSVIPQAFAFRVVVLCASCTVLHYYVQLCYKLYIPLIIAYSFDLDLTVISVSLIIFTYSFVLIIYSFLTSMLRSLRLLATLQNFHSLWWVYVLWFNYLTVRFATIVFCDHFIQRYCVSKFHKIFDVFLCQVPFIGWPVVCL